MDPLSAVASSRALARAIYETYTTIHTIKGRPEAFDRINKSLQLIQLALWKIQTHRSGPRASDDALLANAIRPITRRCEHKIRVLHDIFVNLQHGLGSESWQRQTWADLGHNCRNALLELAEGNKVETLMQEILVDLAIVDQYQTFGVATESQVAQLQRKTEEPSTTKPVTADAVAAAPKPLIAGGGTSYQNHQGNSGTGHQTVGKTMSFDEDDVKRSAKSALRCMLHQVFEQREDLLSDRIVNRFGGGGGYETNSLADTWDIFIQTLSQRRPGEDHMSVVCVIDALDECDASEQADLMELLCNYYQEIGQDSRFSIKMLITSRPYSSIRKGLHPLESNGLSLIHLRGETDEEIEKIKQEIDLVIHAEVDKLQSYFQLEDAEKEALLAGLRRFDNRTYLWVHLTLDVIKTQFDEDMDLATIASSLPPSVDAAYERMLSSSPDKEKAKRLLHFIVAALRPLTVEELNFALALLPHHRIYGEVVMIPEARFRERIRELCGLLVTVIDSKVYLLHQTVKEFLVWDKDVDSEEGSSTHGHRPRLMLLDAGADPNKTDESDTSPLDCAIGEDRESIVRMLLDAGADPNAAGQSNRSPLEVAADHDRVSVMQILLDAGADPSLKESTGLNHLTSAVLHDKESVLRALLDAGVDPNVSDMPGLTPLDLASLRSRDSVVRILLDAGADPNASHGQKMRSLGAAVSQGRESVVRMLLDAGADVTLYGEGLLLLAKSRGQDSIVRMLTEAGVDVGLDDVDGVNLPQIARS
ncbi:hypothetical protein HMPREF1624_05807 [Sporothrix schenckii ATCC 58251]|uniref:Uncharacterized protein n=1 Tax=Sporothrix schenckii (strain ATCC 58251 / de Perez 2211183) TaxID=1391915 RepID=U7PRR7_SPOS1|nr:hypothetical protein HMPREF1624_05807 [Sporothrix schenckii ATCC 58251]